MSQRNVVDSGPESVHREVTSAGVLRATCVAMPADGSLHSGDLSRLYFVVMFVAGGERPPAHWGRMHERMGAGPGRNSFAMHFSGLFPDCQDNASIRVQTRFAVVADVQDYVNLVVIVTGFRHDEGDLVCVFAGEFDGP